MQEKKSAKDKARELAIKLITPHPKTGMRLLQTQVAVLFGISNPKLSVLINRPERVSEEAAAAMLKAYKSRNKK